MESSGWRNAVAKQILTGRKYDRLHSQEKYMDKRNLDDYIDSLQELKHFLSYIRNNQNTLRSNLVLDIGTGQGIAAAELQRSSTCEGLRVEGTVLASNPEVRTNLGNNLHITPSETLRGIEASSVAAILSVFSLAYSEAPDKTAEAINRVTVPSGVLKATFYISEHNTDPEMHPHTSTRLAEELRRLGWKVHVDRLEKRGFEIMLAVKPPIIEEPEEIMRKDTEAWLEKYRAKRG